MPRLFVSASAAERLERAAAFLAEVPPGREALLVAAQRDAADELAFELASRREASFGWQRRSFLQLVAELAAPALAARGLAPATSLAVHAIAARAAFEAGGGEGLSRLSRVRGLPGFSRALADTLSELRSAEVAEGTLASALEPEAGTTGSTSLADLGQLLARYGHELEGAGAADRAALVALALERLEEAGSPWPGAPLLLLDVAPLSDAEARLLARLAAEGQALATVPFGDDRTLDRLRSLAFEVPVPPPSPRQAPPGTALEGLRRHLFSEELPPPSPADATVRFFSAPGEGRECVEVARLALEEARDGLPFDEMAVLLRAPELYGPLLESALRRAGIPAWFARGTRRPDPAGRAFLALLDCAVERLSARRFAEYLSLGQVPGARPEGAPALAPPWSAPDDDLLRPAAEAPESASAGSLRPDTDGIPAPAEETDPDLGGTTLPTPRRWEELIVEASVVGGAERWHRRLAGLEAELAARRAEVERQEPESPRLLGIDRDLERLTALRRFALPLVDRLAALPPAATWGDWLDLLADLAPRALARPHGVLAVLAQMRPLAGVGPLGLAEARQALAERLRTLERPRPPRRWGRLFVGTPEQARGRSFEVVFAPGLSEGLFPRRPREDPLLLDDERRRLGHGLAVQEDRGREERLLLRLAAGAARSRLVVSYSRLEAADGRPRVPSFYALDLGRATSGALPDFATLEREAESEAGARLAWPAPLRPERAIDAVEHDLAMLRHALQLQEDAARRGRGRYLLDLNPHLGRSLRSRYARWEIPAWRPEDGPVRTTEGTAGFFARARPTAPSTAYSVTALQHFAACPYRFFLSALLRLEPRREIEPPVSLDPLTYGSLFHEAQAETLRALRSQGQLPLRARGLERARGTLGEVLARIEALARERLAPPILRVWRDELEGMGADLRVWLRRLAEDEAWEPLWFELGFGVGAERSLDPASRPEPVALEGGFRLRGIVDLVERGAGGALRVTDHKTGLPPPGEAPLVTGGGEILQPVLYGLAVEAASGSPAAEGRLWFCTTRGGFGERRVPLDEGARRQGLEVLEVVDRALERGLLVPLPRRRRIRGRETTACDWCDFRPLCGPNEPLRTGRKDPTTLADLHELRSRP